jgi:HTH-type transcriptional regulator/antitoxin HigA
MSKEELSYQPPEVSPPGDTLRDMMDERNLTQAELARRLGRPVQAVNEIMAGKKEITEDTALELERVLQVPAHFWLAREARYREYLARMRDAHGRKAQVPWLERFPIKALQAAGVLPEGRLSGTFKEQLVDDLLRFFGVASPEGWGGQYDKMQAQFRRAKPDQQTDAAAITAWLRMGELAAARLQTADYSAQAGVALVFVPALPGTHVSGVARWVGGKPLIQLSLLGKWNDGFWFSFFHEVAHILKHPTRSVFLDDASSGDAVQSSEEQEANRFATDVLIPRARQAELAGLSLDRASVSAFAQSLGIHPGIVVGQLQHRKLIGYSHPLGQLKARYTIQTKKA